MKDFSVIRKIERVQRIFIHTSLSDSGVGLFLLSTVWLGILPFLTISRLHHFRGISSLD